MTRTARHTSVDGQIVIKTCTNGYLKYHKYQDIEVEVDKTMDQWMTKKLLATTVSSRAVGIRGRLEAMTMRSLEEAKTCKEQENKSVRGRGKGGSRQSLKHIDGDVPMCMRNKDKDGCWNEIERN